MENENFNTVKTYVIRAGRMTDAQKKNYETLSAKWCLPYDAKTKLNFSKIFGNDNPVTIEIGFGMGTVTAQIAAENPDKNYLGLEVHKPGVGKLLGLIEENGLQNVRIIQFDALEVLANMVEDESAAAFHIFFPDPWPKKRHHKRRLIQPLNTSLFAKKLVAGGYVYMATDWAEYAEEALAVFEATSNLKNKYENFAPHQEWKPLTKFEQRGQKEGREIFEIVFVKN